VIRKSSPTPSPFEIVWSPLALARLREIRAYIALENPPAAERLATRIITLAEALKLQPYLGHPSNEPNLRELVIGGTPYVIFYRVRRQQILVTTIHQSAQRK
jgi:toxin ParE1/3/4